MLPRNSVLLLLPILCSQAAVPKELQSLADQARALPPEFAADVLLKLAVSPLANDAKWKRGLLEDAFLSAAQAQSPYARRGDHGLDVADSHLERLTLQTRVVEAMLATDPQRALTMFQDIATPELPMLACQEAPTPDVSVYYQTAAAVFNRAFTPAQRAKSDDIQFLRQRIASVESPSQVVPALKLLDQVELSSGTRSELTAAFAGALDRIHGGDREFAASEALLVSAAVPEMHELLFLPSLRSYIVRHVRGPRCTDQFKGGELPESVTQFNKLISRIDSARIQFRPITPEEAAPLKDDGTYPPAQDHFMQAKYYATVLDDGAVAGSARRNALSGALHFLEQRYDVLANRVLWFQEFRLLFGSPRSDQDWLLDQLVHSRNPVIGVYAQMQKLLGTS